MTDQAEMADITLRRRAYFTQLADISLTLIGRMPLGSDPLPIGTIETDLATQADRMRTDAVACIRSDLSRPASDHAPPASGRSPGLNTVGLLADRLTILLIKQWYMQNVYDDAKGAARLRADNITEIIAALAEAEPGLSSMNTKATTHAITGQADSWEDAFYGLQMINLLLWEAQELLYRADITTLPETELRAYLSFFSKGNLTRNRYIELCETHYWASMG